MKRVALLIVLVVIAGLAGIVRSHSRVHASIAELPGIFSDSSGQARDEIRKSYELAAGARVELTDINGAIKIETSDTTTADVYIERTGASPETLNRRKISIEADSNSLRIHGERGDVCFLARLFGSNPTERVTLKLPRRISLLVKGVNGLLSASQLEGSVEVNGINGRVQVAGAAGAIDLKGVNGNILVGLKRLNSDGVSIHGVNGNIELQLSEGLNADLDAHGMNGRVMSDLPEVTIDRSRHGSYSARIGSGGSSISAHGINGNIRLTRAAETAETGNSQQQTANGQE
jgi:DUF4097 and DUF4098 domain-containing protein YvlB